MDSLLDRTAVLERFDGDEDVIRKIAQLFLEEYPNLLQEIRNAIAQNDVEALRHSAHTLKGAASNFSPAAASEVFKLEQLGKCGTVAGAEAQLAVVERSLEMLVAELTAAFLASVQA